MSSDAGKKKYRAPYSPERLRAGIESYFDECTAKDIFPDYPGLKLRLKLTEDDVSRMCAQSDEYRDIFERARDRRRSWLERRMISEKTSATGCLNALRQPENGGYIDKLPQNADKTLKIKVEGLRNGMEAFK